MPSLKVKISGLKNIEDLNILGDWANGNFDDMVEDLPDILKKSLNTAGYIVKESVKETFATNMPAAARPFKVPATSKGGYKILKPDKLIDAARQSSSDGQHVVVFMGGREKNSPLFISRMYDHDSQPRYVKTKNGVKLARPRFVGKLTGVNYWDPGVRAGEQEAFNAMERIITEHLENKFND